jgi:putative hydroxymethylpyrimidine transport system permease protein
MRAVLTAIAFGLLWQGVILVTRVPPYILPAPYVVALALQNNAGMLIDNALVTAGEVLIGLLIGTLLGVALAIAMTLSTRLRFALRPALVVSQAVPVFALAPVLTLWLGYGLTSKIAMTVLIVFFPLASVFLDGLLATPAGSLDLGQLAAASRWRVLWWLRLPHAVPSLFSGLSIAAVYAPIGAVIGEWVGASKGLGYVMLLANARSKTDLMFAALLIVIGLTVMLHWIASVAAQRLTR